MPNCIRREVVTRLSRSGGHAESHCFSHFDSIDARGKNASRVARALTRWKQSQRVEALKVITIARDPNRR